MKKFKYSEITPEKVYNKRREFVKSLGLGLVINFKYTAWIKSKLC